MKECLSEEILQQYFDGELASARMHAVASHLAGCDACSQAFAELENESNLLMSALAPEFEGAVPTERLNRRIQAAISGIQVVSPVYSQPANAGWKNWLGSVSAIFNLTPQRALAYGGLAAVLLFAAIFGIVRLRSTSTAPTRTEVASVEGDKKTTAPVPVPAATIEEDKTPIEGSTPNKPVKKHRPKLNRQTPSAAPLDLRDSVADVKLLPGERSYLKTIAALDSTIKSGKKTMRPALQAEYERNLALVDRAIAATRSAAKQNPNDPDAVEFMFSAYQSKVDLLNTVADARVYNQPR
jgi:hypothetical protein